MPSPLYIICAILTVALPCYLPLIFIAFAIGRKQVTLAQILIFVTLEAVAIGCAMKPMSWVNSERVPEQWAAIRPLAETL